jgi:hypothetical protein
VLPWLIVGAIIVAVVAIGISAIQTTLDDREWIKKAKSQQPSAPVSTKPSTPPITAKERHEREVRNGAVATLESTLLDGGFDVHVGIVGDRGGDNRHLLIVGEPVNRVFIHNIIGPGLRRSLKRDGFIKITFMTSTTLTGWVGEYDVATNEITTAR